MNQRDVARLMRDPGAFYEPPRLTPPGAQWATENRKPYAPPPDSWPRISVEGLRAAVQAHVGAGDLEAWLATTTWQQKSHAMVTAALKWLQRHNRIYFDGEAWRPGRAR